MPACPGRRYFQGHRTFQCLNCDSSPRQTGTFRYPEVSRTYQEVPSGCLSAAFSLSPSPIHTFLILHSLSKNYLPPIHNFFKGTKIWTDISQKKICKRPISTWKNTQVQIKIVIALLCLKLKRLKRLIGKSLEKLGSVGNILYLDCGGHGIGGKCLVRCDGISSPQAFEIFSQHPVL